MDFQEYNASKKDSVRRPFISLLPVRRQFFQTTVRTEVIIMLYMSDLPMKENPMSLLDELKSAVLLNDQILDNAYCFLMKQTSANMQENSEQRGWELINYLLSIRLPPPPLFAFVLYFICKTLFSCDVSVFLAFF